MYATLIQTLLAAFLAILAHLSEMGGGGMIAAHHSMIGGGKRDIFADWYPRWGTSDLLLALNGIYNQGQGLPHSNSVTTWTDIAGGLVFSRNSRSTANALWTDNALEIDSTKRALLGTVDFSSVPAVTVGVCGYYGMNWGELIQFYQSSSFYVAEWMPSGNNVGAQIAFHRDSSASFIDYTVQERPTYSDIVFTCDTAGDCAIYVNGSLMTSESGGAAAVSRWQNVRRLFLGGDNNSTYPPNGSKLFGVTIYKAALTAQEINSLYLANKMNYGF